MAEYVDFHYMPLEGKITGKQVLKQTEDAINDLGQHVYEIDIDNELIQQAIDTSNQAIDTAEAALSAVTTNRAMWFNTVAEMKATDIALGITAATRGKGVFNDGDGAFYAVRAIEGGDVDSDDTVFLDNGNVAERIKQFNLVAKGNNIVYVANVSELRTSDAVAGLVYGTTGYYSLNDGGAGLYNIRTAISSDTDNGGSIIILDNGNVAELVRPAIVTPVMFGAKGNANYYSYGTKKWYEDIDLSSATPAPYHDNVADKWYVSAVFTDEGIYYKPSDDKYYYSSSATEATYYDNVNNKYYVSAVFANEGIYYEPNDDAYYYSASATEAVYNDNVNGGWYVSAVFTDEGTYEYDGKHWYDAEHTIEAPYYDNVADKWYVTATYSDEGIYTYNGKYWYIVSPTPAPYYDNIGEKWYASATYTNEGVYTYNNKYWYIASTTEAPYYDNVGEKWYVSATYTDEANAYVDGVWYASAVFSTEATDDYNAIQNAVNYAEVVDGLGKRYKIYPTEVLRTGDSYQAICIRKNFKLCNTNIVLGEDADRGMCCIGINTDGYVEIENCEIDGNASNQTTITGDGANHCIVSVRRGGEGYIHVNHCTIKGGRTDGISHRSGYMLLENSMIYADGRNGITCDKSARIFNCTFDNKNAFRLPQYSIYHEPNEGYKYVSDIEIDFCHFVYATKCIDLYVADSTSVLRNVIVRGCDCKETDKKWNCVISCPDGTVENVLIERNVNVVIQLNANNNARVSFKKAIIDNNVGEISLGLGNASSDGYIDELIIRNTSLVGNITVITMPRTLRIIDSHLKIADGATGNDRYMFYVPGSRNPERVHISNCRLDCVAVLYTYSVNANYIGEYLFMNNTVTGGQLRSYFKRIYLNNCRFTYTSSSSYTISQPTSGQNKYVNASGCTFAQSNARVYRNCGTVTDVGCVYSYTE